MCHLLDPEGKMCEKIDVFLNNQLRFLTNTPRYLPITDLQTIFQYSPFYQRWQTLASRFINHRCTKLHDSLGIQYEPGTTWKFQLDPTLSALMLRQPHLRNVFFRKLPPLPERHECDKSVYHRHSQVNQLLQCYLKRIPLVDESRPPPNSVKEIPPRWLQKAKEIQNLIVNSNDDRIHAYTDASYDRVTKQGNGAIIIIQAESISTICYNLDDLQLNSSTRAEQATITEALNIYPDKPFQIYTDSQNAIDNFNDFKDEVRPYEKIANADLISQTVNIDRAVTFVKVVGHSDADINNYADYMADLSFRNYQKSSLEIVTSMDISREIRNMQDLTHFRLFRIRDALNQRRTITDEFWRAARKLYDDTFKLVIPR